MGDVRGWVARSNTSSMVCISLSAGACRTSRIEPRRQFAQPTRPTVLSSSSRKYAPRTALYVKY